MNISPVEAKTSCNSLSHWFISRPIAANLSSCSCCRPLAFLDIFTMKTTKEKIADIKSKIKKCLGDKKEANSVIDVLCYSQEEEPSVMLAAVRGLQQIFANFFASGYMSAASDKEKDPAQGRLCEWLQDQYYTTCGAILQKLDSTNIKLREAALVAMLKFVEVEGKHPLHRQHTDCNFPEKLMQDVVDKLLSTSEDREALIVRLSELTEYDDVRYYLMKALKHSLRNNPNKGRGEVYLCNVLTMIYSLQLPQGDTDLTPTMLTIPDGEAPPPVVSSMKAHKKLFTACLMAFLKSDLSPTLYRRVLTKLDDKLLPFLSSPLLLADFLTESYNIGGAISLLALNGLFILIKDYNLDYPDFYRKLYSLFQPQIFQAKYCARFFHLADIFLSSTHLPARLVAAFVKRLSRLALTAPPAAATLCVVLVRNLLVRHPACRPVVNRPHHTCPSDPFLDGHHDPYSTHAMDSSLWEIKTLQSHYSPEVAQMAMKISQHTKQETDIAAYLEDTSENVLERSVKKKPVVGVPLTPDNPSCLFHGRFKTLFAIQ